jgi:protein-disulfide isomerase
MMRKNKFMEKETIELVEVQKKDGPETETVAVAEVSVQKGSWKEFMTPAAIIIAGIIVAVALVFTVGGNGGAAAPEAQNNALPADASKVDTTSDPIIGDANAPVTIAYWFDYQCPFCQQDEENTMPDIIKNYVDTGKVKIVFKDFPFLGPDSNKLAEFSDAVWTIAPKDFYTWHKSIFDNQGQEGSGWATDAKIRSITEGVLGKSETDQVFALVEKNATSYDQEMSDDRDEGQQYGINGTPAFMIGKQLIIGAEPYSTLSQAIDSELAAAK